VIIGFSEINGQHKDLEEVDKKRIIPSHSKRSHLLELSQLQNEEERFKYDLKHRPNEVSLEKVVAL
jgi:hypothetical protein